MKNFKVLSTIKYVFTLLVLVSITAACSNSTSGEEEIHQDAEGFVLRLNGDIIVEKNPNEDLINNFPELTVGEETAGIEVSFTDDGVEFTPDEPELYLDFAISNPDKIQIEQHEGEFWEFHVRALEETGSSPVTLTILLMHNDHDDFQGGPIEITVNPAPSN